MSELDNAADYYKNMSWKAKRLVAETSQIADDFKGRLGRIEQRVLVEYKEDVPVDEFTLKKKFIKLYKKTYTEIFKQEILDAAFKSIEYTRKYRFFTQLAELVEENIDFILDSLVTEGFGGARLIMELVAGDFNDLMEGVEIARRVLKAYNQYTRWNKMPNKARRDMVWKEFVWPNDEYYDKTINTRFSAWGNKAPYWVLLDQGNQEFDGAYPKFTATDFFYEACLKINIDLLERVALYKTANISQGNVESTLRYETQMVTVSVSDLIIKAVKEFYSNPNNYNPGDEFARYVDIMDGYEYKVYVTPGRRVGVPRIR